MRTARELAFRHLDGLEVTLLWDARSGAVSVELVDDRDASLRVFRVDPACALDAFHHPFVYAPVLTEDLPEAALVAAIDDPGGGW